ncbi:MAG: FHA domain-containing protein [Planctomycetota bacterium]|jgi:hypothetical protein
MANYVLEILDGDRAGEVVPVADRPVRIGRRPGNDLVLADEKTSGVHAEVVPEGDRHVLRDLGSTNGTFLDGKRITELVLTPGDVVTVGRLQVKFRLAGDGASAPVDAGELSVRRLDAGRVQKRSGATAVVALVALLAAGGGAWFWLRGKAEAEGGDGPAAGGGPRAALVVDGNKLPNELAQCEVEEGWERVGGATFQTIGRGHSGAGALQCERVDGPDGKDFAVLRTQKPLTVLPGRTVTLAAHLRCTGGARAAVRVLLGSDNEQMPFRFRTGSAVVAHPSGFQRVSLPIAVPPGCNHLQVEVVAVMPAAGDAVAVDDVAVTDGGDATLVELKLADTGQTMLGSGAALALRSVDMDAPVILRAVLPGEVPAEFAGLHKAELCALSDLGASLQVTPIERGFAVAANGVPSLRLALPADAAGGLLIASGGDPSFAAAPGEGGFQAQSLLTGAGTTRALWRFDAPVACTGKVGSGTFALDAAATRFEVVLDFPAERKLAIDGVAKARQKAGGGRPGEALDLLRELVQRAPMDSEVLAEAQVLRTELMATQTRAVRRLQADLDEAQFFNTRGGFERVAFGVDSLEAIYGDQNLDDPKGLKALRTSALARLQALDDGNRGAERARLEQLTKVFADAQQPVLAKWIEDYVARHLGDGAGKPAGQQERGKPEDGK